MLPCVCDASFSNLLPLRLIWLKVGREWAPLITTRDLPEQIVDAVKRAQPEWCQLQESAKRPMQFDLLGWEQVAQLHLMGWRQVAQLTGFYPTCIGKYPLSCLGQIHRLHILHEHDWIRYFYETAVGHDTQMLKELAQACAKEMTQSWMMEDLRNEANNPVPYRVHLMHGLYRW